MQRQLERAGLALACVALAALSACASTPKPIATAAPGVDFGRYSTYGFLDRPSTDSARYESLVTNFLKVAVAQEMDQRGFSYSESPELLINFYIHTREKIRTRSVPTTSAYYGFRDPFYDPWYDYGVGVAYETRIDQFTEGTLNIDVVDASSNKLIWEGILTGRVTDEAVRNLERSIDTAVKIIMKAFPVPPGGAPQG